MSELETMRVSRAAIRLRLLGTASALGVLAAIPAQAAQSDRPTVWIELGAQTERMDGGWQPFLPSFSKAITDAGFDSPAKIQRPPRYAIGGEAKVTFEPEDSDWLVSAAVRYGRSNAKRHEHQSVNVSTPVLTLVRTGQRNSDTKPSYNESHAILDFQAGKDFGIGRFGSGGSSVWSLGLRAAQFESGSDVQVDTMPDFGFDTVNFFGQLLPLGTHRHTYNAKFQSDRSFAGLGPSAAWDASATLAGSKDAGVLAVDWGLNASVLFGRQKASVHSQTASFYAKSQQIIAGFYHFTTLPAKPPAVSDRSHSVVVPNVGGFAGLSMKFPNAKVSLGYRADFFFGAMDVGIASRKAADRNFYGPFATISIGLGG